MFLKLKKLLLLLTLFVLGPTNISLSETINKINIIGNDRIPEETILMFSEISIGDDIEINDLNTILKKVYDSNFFNNVSVKLLDNVLSIKVSENPIIENIYYEGVKAKKLKIIFSII